MNWLESIIYGLISGLTEFLPISSSAHQQMYLHLCGESSPDPIRDLLVHIAMLMALKISCRPMIALMKRNGTQRMHSASKSQLDYQFVRAATIPMLLAFFILSYIFKSNISLIGIAFVLILNGLILFVPDHLIKGNKDSGAMSTFDSFLVGLAGSLSAISGFSRLGAIISMASIRGADKQSALRWALLLSIPALWALIIVDILKLFGGYGVFEWKNLLSYVLSAFSAFGSGYCGIKLIRSFSLRQNYSIFTYYCWGAALITFFLYLTVV